MDKKTEKQNLSAQTPSEEGPAGSARPSKLRWGRGVYRSKDVPIVWLDRLIIALIVAIIILTTVFAINGGYNVTFETGGGTAVETQRLRHGNLVTEPEAPQRAGYDFTGWYNSSAALIPWDFASERVSGDTTIYAGWTPAKVTVKFDLDGGTLNGSDSAAPLEGVFGEAYGALPTPTKAGAVFDGWVYSGQKITSDTLISVNGEHVLTATWK